MHETLSDRNSVAHHCSKAEGKQFNLSINSQERRCQDKIEVGKL